MSLIKIPYIYVSKPSVSLLSINHVLPTVHQLLNSCHDCPFTIPLCSLPVACSTLNTIILIHLSPTFSYVFMRDGRSRSTIRGRKKRTILAKQLLNYLDESGDLYHTILNHAMSVQIIGTVWHKLSVFFLGELKKSQMKQFRACIIKFVSSSNQVCLNKKLSKFFSPQISRFN